MERDVNPSEAESAHARAVQEWLRAFPDDAPVIVVPVFNAFEDVVECVDSVLTTTPRTAPLLVLDDGSTDDRIAHTLTALAETHGFLYLRKSVNSGFVATMNAAFAWTIPHDVILLNSDVIVPPGWVERLRTAAYARTTIATATPLTNHGTLLSVPYRDTPVHHLPRGMTINEFDRRIRETSKRLYPIIPTAIGHCTYFKRSALNTVGAFDPFFSPGYGEEVDFSQRAVMAGFSHVAADDLFVFHRGSRSFGQTRSYEREFALRKLRGGHERTIATRYPWYHAWVRSVSRFPQSRLTQAVDNARLAALGKSVAIDARCIGDVLTGTQVITLELIHALAATKHPDDRLSVIVNDGVDKRHLFGIEKVVDELIGVHALQDARRGRFDLVHRPFQVHAKSEWETLQGAAHRCVVTQLDFIAFSNPSYFETVDHWLRYRALTQSVLASADGVVSISEDAARDAEHQGLDIPAERACVTYLGVDHGLLAIKPAAPADAAFLQQTPFLLVLGTNFKHKNRGYAIKILQGLIEEHGWPGRLVFAGPRVGAGGSGVEEAIERLAHPGLDERIHYLEHVDEGEKQWLLKNAALVLYPSIYEGFGLVPFEAAAVGTPTLATRATSLNEVLGDDVLSLELLDVRADTETAWALLADPCLRSRQVERIKARGAAFTWETVARTAWGFYDRVLRMPPRMKANLTTDHMHEVANNLRREGEKQRKEFARQRANLEMALREQREAFEKERRGFERERRREHWAFKRERRAFGREYKAFAKWREEYERLQAWALDMEAQYLRLEQWAKELEANLATARESAAKPPRGRFHALTRVLPGKGNSPHANGNDPAGAAARARDRAGSGKP